MTTTIRTEHANELILVEEALDSGGSAAVALGLVNQDGSDTFPGRTLSPDQAEELAAGLTLSAAVARANAGLAPAPSQGDQAHVETLNAIRAAVQLTRAASSAVDAQESAAVQREPEDAPEPEGLPIDGYDGLSASNITKSLSGLSDAQLAQVLAYEQSHRNRKTVCERIAALQSAAARAAD